MARVGRTAPPSRRGLATPERPPCQAAPASQMNGSCFVLLDVLHELSVLLDMLFSSVKDMIFQPCDHDPRIASGGPCPSQDVCSGREEGARKFIHAPGGLAASSCIIQDV